MHVRMGACFEKSTHADLTEATLVTRRIIVTIIHGALLCASATTNAAILNGFGAYSSAGTASNCPSFCTSSNGGDFQSDSDGGEFSNSAFAEETSYGLGRAQATLSGLSYLPELKVLGSADEGMRGEGTSFGIQGFTYVGPSTNLTLNMTLDGSITNNPTGYTDNTLGASIAVLKGSSLSWFADFATLVFEVAGATTTRVGVVQMFLSEAGLNQSTTDFISFDINSGEDFYVVTEMTATGQNGIADAWNTLTLNFDDDSGLTPAIVPEPAAFALLATAVMLLLGHRQKR
jgi:hypothetical protein